MATQQSTDAKLGLARCAGTGAIVLAVLFLLCWAGAATGALNGSHMFINLFTFAAPASIDALAIGLCWSLVLGAATGALTALAYNSLGFLAPR